MKNEKRSTLEAAGWKLGGAAEFLGLTPEESRLVELKLSLASMIKDQRKLAKLSQTKLANRVKSSQSRIAKAEAADEFVSLELYYRLLFALDMSRSDVRFEVEPRVLSVGTSRQGRLDATRPRATAKKSEGGEESCSKEKQTAS